ncbi:MAG: hypothetical protein J5I93_21140 [Pirellulaceae bacterium]|nr:hypothetical protein [Pirellulaceae bacterium]
MAFVVMVIVVFIAVMTTITRGGGRSTGRNMLFREAAHRLHGVYQPTGPFSPPRVQFRHGSVTATLDAGYDSRASGSPFLSLWLPWTNRQFECTLISRNAMDDGRAGSPPSSTGVNALVEGFHAESPFPEQLRRLLSEGFQWQLQRLLHAGDLGPLRVTIGQGTLKIRKLMVCRHAAELDEFVRLALDLYDQAILTQTEGIEFIDGDQVQIVDDARCQVCGDAITSDMVFCRRCKTPHHQECWHYYGSCSTYGCRETQYRIPPQASPVQQPPEGNVKE